MKKTLACLLMLTLGMTPVFAREAKTAPSADDAAEPAKDDPLYVGLSTGLDLPVANWDSHYLLGSGTQALVGAVLDRNWAVQLTGGETFFTGTGFSLDQFRVLVEAKYLLGRKGFHPYLLAGPGMVFQVLSPSGDNTANFDALVGVGVQWDLAPRTHWFLEADHNFILSQTTAFTDIPITTGISVGL